MYIHNVFTLCFHTSVFTYTAYVYIYIHTYTCTYKLRMFSSVGFFPWIHRFHQGVIQHIRVWFPNIDLSEEKRNNKYHGLPKKNHDIIISFTSGWFPIETHQKKTFRMAPGSPTQTRTEGSRCSARNDPGCWLLAAPLKKYRHFIFYQFSS